MLAYYESKISPNIGYTPEGYMICHNAAINRVGIYQYPGQMIMAKEEGSPEEIAKAKEFNKNIDPGRIYDVLRRPEEVFSPAALASFEGKPICDDHPSEDVTTENIHAYERGHAQNIRRGTGPDEGLTLADLYITDPQLIEDIKNGKRQISCGYDYDIYRNKNGTFEQRSIRGNHIAVVQDGRAGGRVAIKDSTNNERGKTMAAKSEKSSLWGRVFKIAAKDESMTPEDLEDLAKMKKADDEDIDLEKAKKEEAVEPKAPAADDDPIMAKLDEILSMLQQFIADCAEEETRESGDDLEKMIGEDPKQEDTEAGLHEEMEHDDDGSVENQEPEFTVSPEDLPESAEKRQAADAKAIQGFLKKSITDPKAYKAAAKDAASYLREVYNKPINDEGYAKFVEKTNAAKQLRAATDSVRTNDQIIEAQQNAYNKRNPHMKKEVK